MAKEMERLLRAFALFIFLLHPACVWAGYTATELFKVNWGENPGEFLVRPSLLEGADTPENPDDDIDDPGAGPYKAFVDPKENFIFISTMGEIKGFTNTGKLMFEISGKSYNYTPYSRDRYPIDLYVDSDNKIYLTFFPNVICVPILDYSGALIDSLILFGEFGEICFMNWTYSGDLMFFSDDYGWSTYRDGEFHRKGASGIISAGGEFNDLVFVEPNTLRFWVYTGPDEWGMPSWKDSNEIEVEADFLVYAELLNSQEPKHLYVLMSFWDKHVWHELWIYDLEYNFVDKVSFWKGPMYFDLCPNPFITGNGNIYESRCLGDGLHVIRWTEE